MDRDRMSEFLNNPIRTSLYSINLKTGHECKLLYGRKSYDFQEGTLMCTAPNQIMQPLAEQNSPSNDSKIKGWNILFHPDLLRNHSLAQKIQRCGFFKYQAHEALHLSEQERKVINFLVSTIEEEYQQKEDAATGDIILSHLDSLISYCQRFYDRQFESRKGEYQDIFIRFENLLEGYFSQNPEERGLPSVEYCAKELGYSCHYLSDLLKKETGQGSQEHIHGYIVELAKNYLRGTDETVSTIAYRLGFEYPQHFSSLFKKKTGQNPTSYRNQGPA